MKRPGEDPDTCVSRVKGGSSPTEECLRAAAEHVLHDLRLLRLAWESRSSRIGWTLWFVTARGVMDFLFCFRRQSGYDDILAVDYVPDWNNTAQDLLKQKPADYDAVRDAANKYSAHLTYSRVGAAVGLTEPSGAVHEFLLGTASVWLDRLPPDRRVWFGSGL